MFGQKTLAFCKHRKCVELVLLYTKDILRNYVKTLKDPKLQCKHKKLEDKVVAYRGGYLPKDRRRLERGIFEGSVIGITATNALELGVDIGSLDCILMLGYPGSTASMWQQAGRAGRTKIKPNPNPNPNKQPSTQSNTLIVMVAWDSPLEQFYMRNPNELFNRQIESTSITSIASMNKNILRNHLLCAAVEYPITFLGSISKTNEILDGGFVSTHTTTYDGITDAKERQATRLLKEYCFSIKDLSIDTIRKMGVSDVELFMQRRSSNAFLSFATILHDFFQRGILQNAFSTENSTRQLYTNSSIQEECFRITAHPSVTRKNPAISISLRTACDSFYHVLDKSRRIDNESTSTLPHSSSGIHKNDYNIMLPSSRDDQVLGINWLFSERNGNTRFWKYGYRSYQSNLQSPHKKGNDSYVHRTVSKQYNANTTYNTSKYPYICIDMVEHTRAYWEIVPGNYYYLCFVRMFYTCV